MCKHNSTKSIWHQKGLLTIPKIIQETKKQFSGIKQTLPVTLPIKYPEKYPKVATRLLQQKKNNLPPLEAWTKNIATKMADSEFRNHNKKSKSKLTNQNTQKMN